jgi:hypothetical protein
MHLRYPLPSRNLSRSGLCPRLIRHFGGVSHAVLHSIFLLIARRSVKKCSISSGGDIALELFEAIPSIYALVQRLTLLWSPKSSLSSLNPPIIRSRYFPNWDTEEQRLLHFALFCTSPPLALLRRSHTLWISSTYKHMFRFASPYSPCRTDPCLDWGEACNMDDIKSGIVLWVGSPDFVAHAIRRWDRRKTSLGGDLEEEGFYFANVAVDIVMLRVDLIFCYHSEVFWGRMKESLHTFAIDFKS